MTNHEYVMSLPIEDASIYRDRIMRRFKGTKSQKNRRYRKWLKEERWKKN